MAESEGRLPEFIEDKKKHHRPAIVKGAMNRLYLKKNKGNYKSPPAPQSQAWTDLEMKGDTGPQTLPEAAVPGDNISNGRRSGSKTSPRKD